MDEREKMKRERIKVADGVYILKGDGNNEEPIFPPQKGVRVSIKSLKNGFAKLKGRLFF